MPIGYNYGGYPGPNGYYAPPMPDQLAQLRQNQFQQPLMQNQMPIQQPMQNQATQMQQPMMPSAQPASMTGPVFVNGEAGAKGYLVSAGNTVMLIDADPDANTFWLKSADASGMPSMRTFDYTERIVGPKPITTTQTTPTVEYVTREAFDALQREFEALSAELTALKNNKPKKGKESVTDAE